MAKSIAVIGLGVLGRVLVKELADAGADVLAIDSDIEMIELVKDAATYAVRMDATDVRMLREQNLEDVDAVVLTIGDNFEALILTIQELLHLGVTNIYARATSLTHRRILERMGIEHIISPEEDAAVRLARRLVNPGLLDYLDLSEDYQIVEVSAPTRLIGKTLVELELTRRYHVNVVTIRRKVDGRDTIVGVPTAETRIEPEDVLILLGKPDDIRRLIDQNQG